MRLFLGLFLIAGGITYAQADPNLANSTGQTEAGSPSNDCSDCLLGQATQFARSAVAITDEASTCPENVRQIRLLMAATYGSCDAMNVRLTQDRLLERVRAVHNGQGNRIERIRDLSCTYGTDEEGSEDGNNCTDISTEEKYNNAVRNHPYNSITPKCESLPQCEIDEEQRPCPGFFFLGNGHPDPGPYRGKGTINPASNRFLNRDIKGNEFIGWNCSEYVATAMRLAGLNMKSCGNHEDQWGSWNVQGMSAVADDEGNCSCMDVVDLSDPNEKIKPGDMLLYDGHVMMVEASDPEFMSELTNPTLNTNCDENENGCEWEIHNKCSEDNIRPDDLQFSINHSSDSFGGIGPSSMNYADYEGVRGYSASDWSTMETFQDIRGRVRTLFNQTNEFSDFSSDQPTVNRIRTAYSMWLEGRMETSVFFEVFLKEKTDTLNLSNTDREALESIDRTARVMADVRRGSPSNERERQSQQRKLTAYSMWLEGRMEGYLFKSVFLGEAGARTASTWPGIRKHMSFLCKSRLCKKYDIDTEYCEQVTDLANKEQSTKDNRFFKVIRHNSEKEGCVDENPPRLENPCGDTCDDRASRGCLYSSN